MAGRVLNQSLLFLFRCDDDDDDDYDDVDNGTSNDDNDGAGGEKSIRLMVIYIHAKFEMYKEMLSCLEMKWIETNRIESNQIELDPIPHSALRYNHIHTPYHTILTSHPNNQPKEKNI